MGFLKDIGIGMKGEAEEEGFGVFEFGGKGGGRDGGSLRGEVDGVGG